MKKVSFREDILPLKNELYRLALRITMSREEAEDIVQETLIKVWNRRKRWEEIDSMEAFCLTICRNLALDSIKRKGNQLEYLDETTCQQPTTLASPYEKMLQKDRMEVIGTFINTLPEKQKSCMQLRDFEGRSYKEIAQIMDISEDQVKVNIFRARQTLKNKLQNIGKNGL